MVKIAIKIRAGCEKNIYVKTSKNIPLFSIDTSTDKIKSDFFLDYTVYYICTNCIELNSHSSYIYLPGCGW